MLQVILVRAIAFSVLLIEPASLGSRVCLSLVGIMTRVKSDIACRRWPGTPHAIDKRLITALDNNSKTKTVASQLGASS